MENTGLAIRCTFFLTGCKNSGEVHLHNFTLEEVRSVHSTSTKNQTLSSKGRETPNCKQIKANKVQEQHYC